MSAAMLDRRGDVFVLSLGDGENRFDPDQCAALERGAGRGAGRGEAASAGHHATGKFWSNGLDLEWLGRTSGPAPSAVDQYHRLLAAFLGAGVPTVAAVQGHAFAAGAMFAAAHDHVVMRADRGYWCVPEADIGMPSRPA